MHDEVAPAGLHLVDERLQLRFRSLAVLRRVQQRAAFRRELRPSRMDRVVERRVDAEGEEVARLGEFGERDVETRRRHGGGAPPNRDREEAGGGGGGGGG